MKFPKYVEEILKDDRIKLAPINDHKDEYWGYCFKLYRKSNNQRSGTFEEEVNKFVAWANRNYADAKILEYKRYTDKEHRKPWYKVDYVLLGIWDPVAKAIEYYKK